jgi:hypothetical protein
LRARTGPRKKPSWCQAPRHLRLGLAEGRLLEGDRGRLPEVVADEPPQPGPVEQLEHLEREHGRVDRQQPAGPVHPEPRPVGHLERRLRLELLVVALRGRLAAADAIAQGEGAVDQAREAQRPLGIDQAAHEGAAVAEDRGAEEAWGEVGRRELRQRVALGQGPEVGRREFRLAAVGREQADSGEVTEAQEAALGVAPRLRPIGLGEAIHLGQQLLRRLGPIARRARRARRHRPLGDGRVTAISPAPAAFEWPHTARLYRAGRVSSAGG